ncbi:MAG: calcium-binding protein, partial [Rhizobiales bacterium]|nr:calcium-binding protein [Hyphomicrobiales bacterium]
RSGHRQARRRLGNDALYGGNDNDELVGDEGADLLGGGNGNDILEGGTGNDRMFGNAGIDTFVFEIADDSDTIMDFADNADRIDLTSYDFANANVAKSFAAQVGANVVFNFGAGDILTVNNITLAQLTGVDFIL